MYFCVAWRVFLAVIAWLRSRKKKPTKSMNSTKKHMNSSQVSSFIYVIEKSKNNDI